jgi:aspartyl/asparaginyl beta-hydroxylase (cupin superfamily)
MATSPMSTITLPPRFSEYIAGLRNNDDAPRMRYYPGLTARSWHDPSRFAIARALEKYASVIIQEGRNIAPNAFHQESERIDRVGNWDVFFLYDRGRRHESNCLSCPRTTDIVESHRSVRSLSGLVYFSRMSAGTKVMPHRGPTNMRLRCHLGIDIPEHCGLKVDGVNRTWNAGKCIVFDDSIVHEAWNAGDRDRLVLIVDVWHPDLSDEEVLLLEGLERYAAAQAKHLRKYWKRNDLANQKVQP